jgi:hypothetical protein
VAPHGIGRRDQGQVLPLMVLVVLVAIGAAVLLGRLGVQVIDRARARTAADAAALAGVTGGRSAAQHAATANGGRLTRFTAADGATEVEVQVGGSRASARARPGGPRAAADPTRVRTRGAPGNGHRRTPARSAPTDGPWPAPRKPSGTRRAGRLRSVRSKRGYSSVG